MLNATKIRLYPTDEQAQSLAVQFGCARWVYNNALEETRRLYRETGKGQTFYKMSAKLPLLKKEHEWLKDANAQMLQQALASLAAAYENFFAKRAKYPKFKKRHKVQSIRFPQEVKLKDSRIYLPKLGWMKCIIHREIVGKIKTVTVSKTRGGRYYASILTDDGVAMPVVSTDGKAIGVDVGLTHLAVTSDGSKFNNPRHLRKAEKNLKRKQRKLSRKQKGSNGRNKARIIMARAHERVANARADYLHKLSRRIVDENQVIAVEDINVKGIMKNHNLAKATGDVGWGMFRDMLEYKCARAGKAFVKCDRWYPSTKTCSDCGYISESKPLNIRAWTCPQCGVHHDRDINAAKNIRDEGLRILAGGSPATASGGNVRRRRGSNPSKTQLPAKLEAPSFMAG